MNFPKLTEFEGAVTHLYLDTRGNVTAGVGHLCATEDDAAALTGWDHPENVRSDFRALKQLEPGRPAEYYARFCVARLSPQGIQAALEVDAAREVNHFKGVAPEYDSFPGCVRDALGDMAFNLGGAFLLKRNADQLLVWPHLHIAIGQRNWASAAANCKRSGIGDGRNEWTKQQFLAGVANG